MKGVFRITKLQKSFPKRIDGIKRQASRSNGRQASLVRVSATVKGNTQTKSFNKTAIKGIAAEASPDAWEVLRFINYERANNHNGLRPLIMAPDLNALAQLKAEDVRTYDYEDDISPRLGTFGDMLRGYNVSFDTSAVEMILRSPHRSTPAEAVRVWTSSMEARSEIILSSIFTHTGVGHATTADGRDYWVQIFVDRGMNQQNYYR